jgi:DNA-binding NarL/FixJ family response regulator
MMTSFNFEHQPNESLNSEVNQNKLEINSPEQHQDNQIEGIHKIRVIVIENHELARMGIKTALLQNENIEVVGDAGNATEGLQLLNNLQPDIAIIDIGLSDKDGIQLTREIKIINPEIKVLILTLHDSKETVLTAFAAGADSYCMKDIRFQKLIEAIHLTYQGDTWIDPAIAKFVLEQAQRNSLYFSNLDSQNSDEAVDKEMLDMYTLTSRELEILSLIVSGKTNAAIATKLYITIGTVKAHVRNILMKVGAEDRTQAAVHALRYGLLD